MLTLLISLTLILDQHCDMVVVGRSVTLTLKLVPIGQQCDKQGGIEFYSNLVTRVYEYLCNSLTLVFILDQQRDRGAGTPERLALSLPQTDSSVHW